jgi:translation initiation factor 3 subunit M
MVSSTMVNVSDDAELRLVTLLCEAEGESLQDTCTKYLSDGSIHTLLTTIITSTSAMQTLQQMEPIHEVLASVAILSSMIQRLETTESINDVIKLLLDSICTGPLSELPSVERKIAMISVMYNMFDKQYKYVLLDRMIQLAGNHCDILLQPETTLGRLISSPLSTNTVVIITSLPPIVSMLHSWNVTDVERRSLYTTICTVLPQTDIRKQRFLLLLVETYTDKTTVDDFGINAAKEVTIGTIRDPVTLFRDQRNLLSQPAIQALQQHDDALFSLLTIFQEGTMLEYENFISVHGGEANVTATLYSQWGLDTKACVRYMKIFSLCTLAIGQDVITYQDIAKALHLNDEIDHVESWVIAAVNSGLLQAKMDQLKEIVMIERCVVRKFDMDQWKQLQSKLTLWRDHVGNVLGALKQNNNEVTA